MTKPNLPLVYACSGCSSAAQMANDLALRLDCAGLAEMSCIAGVGGGVAALVRLAQSGRPVLALDGCKLACVQACLQQIDVTADRTLLLSELGVIKRKHQAYAAEQAEEIWPMLSTLANSLTKASSE
ncbi:putative zinc-binding protein [Aquitalea aquatica]|uniref:Zinc-binding protein n=1 Tax=Aquitalea aquatica TaxID=3044273 RepID=A0A838Y1Y7_9NEIS|nr:putative zinc-binding protein [Aquitalea magnusonii]MBA4708676.1 zinc-binding protein [Aquitalea magnusonii]